jgi:polyisoprenoid-binding protein YceI
MRVWTAVAAALALAACSQPAPEAPPPEAAPTVQAPSGEYALDANHSTLTVRALHFGLARYVVRFNNLSGTMTFNAENPAQSTVNVSVAMDSIDTTYANATGQGRDFDAELQNSQWTDAATFPAATFVSTSVEQTGPRTARVSGDLTFRGVTRPLVLDVTYNGSWAMHPAGVPIAGVGFSATGTIKRSEFGMTVLQPTGAGIDGVSDDVELLIEAEFNRPNEQGATPAPATPAEPVN